MMAGGVLVAICVVFWILAFMTGRRFGVLGLALAAGALLSSAWSEYLIDIVDRAGVSFAVISTAGIVSAVLVLLPAVLLLFSGPSYKGKKGRMVGALLFAAFATALIAESLGSALILDSTSQTVFDFITDNKVYIVTAGIAVALLDVLGTHTVRSKDKH